MIFLGAFSLCNILLGSQAFANSYQCAWEFQKLELPTISGCASFIEKNGSAYFHKGCKKEVRDLLRVNIMLPLFKSFTNGPNKRVMMSLVNKGNGKFSGWVSGIGDPRSGLIPNGMTRGAKLQELYIVGAAITGDYLAPIDKAASRQMPEGHGRIDIWPENGRLRIYNEFGSILFLGGCETL